jgi:hypothetical protein
MKMNKNKREPNADHQVKNNFVILKGKKIVGLILEALGEV